MPASDPALRVEIARSGGFGKARAKKLTEQRAANLREVITAAVDESPPLTRAQKADLAYILLAPRGEAIAG